MICSHKVASALSEMKTRPSLEFYPGDWLRDPVSGCSLAAQGLWFRMMIVMHDARPYGHVVASNGQPLSDKEIAKRCGAGSVAEMRKVMGELSRLGIHGLTGDPKYAPLFDGATIDDAPMDLSPLSITEPGVIYSRRMVKDRRLALIRWFVSPKGKVLSTQTCGVCSYTCARSAEAEEEVEVDLLFKESERQVPREASSQQKAAGLVMAALEVHAAGFTVPNGGRIAAWIRDYGETFIAAVIVDLGAALDGKGAAYLQACLRDRKAANWTPVKRTRGNLAAAPELVAGAHDPEPVTSPADEWASYGPAGERWIAKNGEPVTVAERSRFTTETRIPWGTFASLREQFARRTA